MSIYQLKPAFQALLRPGVRRLHRAGVTANQVTVLAGVVSVALGLGLYVGAAPGWAFVSVPVWMLLRMALNAMDGMLAREHGMQTPLGACLNELSDVVSDAALYLPFAAVLPGNPVWLAALVVVAGLSEMAGVLGVTVGASRRYDGPLGKSDRALVFGALGLWVAVGGALPGWLALLMPVLVLLTAWTVVRRVRGALDELALPQ